MKPHENYPCIREMTDGFLMMFSFFDTDVFCDPLGDYNVYALSRALNNTDDTPLQDKSVIMAATRVSLSNVIVKNSCLNFIDYSENTTNLILLYVKSTID